MKSVFKPAFIAFMSLLAAACAEAKVYDISEFGAVGDGITDNTAAINAAVQECAGCGGGVVLVPKGEYVTGTLYLKPKVCLKIVKGATLVGTANLDAYGSYIPSKDMSRYDSGVGSSNQNCVSDARWCRALIVACGADGASVTGGGRIDAGHIEDPLGEEGMRGPHTVIVAESKNVKIENLTIERASNYAVLAYEIENCHFRNLLINEGWDGIHIRGAKNSSISNCSMCTGDDCIAGGYWENFTIANCSLNSSCNGIRMIMPSENLKIENCSFYGPGKYPHRTSSSKGGNMLYAISLEPGGWGAAPGELSGIVIRNCSADNVLAPLSVTLQDDNHCKDIIVENCSASNIYRMALSVKSWGTASTESVTLRNCTLQFDGIDDPELPETMKNLPFDRWPFFPSWGAYFRNVEKVSIENCVFSLKGNDYREKIIYDNVGEINDFD